jgi:Lamin Tail Domain
MKKYLTLLLVLFYSGHIHLYSQNIPPNIYISEILYDSPLNEYKFDGKNGEIGTVTGYHNNGEYIKLFNPTSSKKDISGWMLIGTNVWEQYCFPDGTCINPNGSLILAYKNDPSYDFFKCYKVTGVNVIYQSSIILNNYGEHLELIDKQLKTVDKVSYGKESKSHNKELFADNSNGGSFKNLTSLKRTRVYYQNSIPTDSGNDDFTYGDASPTGTGSATSNQSSLSISNSELISMTNSSFSYPVIWFKTTSVVISNSTYYAWKDFSGNDAILRKYDPRGVGYGDEFVLPSRFVKNYNFNPALKLSFQDVSKRVLNTKSNFERTTIMGIWGPNEDNAIANDNFIFGVRSKEKESVLFTKRQVVPEKSANRTTFLYGGDGKNKNFQFQSNLETEKGFKEQSLHIGTYFRTTKAGKSLWGENKESYLTLGSYDESLPTFNNPTTTTYEGYTPELLVFDRALTAKESQIYQTYLAVKYGCSLDTTYLAPDGAAMWDYDENTSYNHRITAYSRQDALGLYQTLSTTSYEEAPYYTYLKGNDSFDGGDINAAPSRNKLLVIGKQPASLFADGEFVIWGDNNDSISVPAYGYNLPNFRAMGRKWLIRTNRHTTPPPIGSLSWSKQNMIMLAANSEKHQFYVRGSASKNAYAVTAIPLQGDYGHFEWVADNPIGAPTTIKFGTNKYTLTANSNDYGYKIFADGKVYKIVRGVVATSYFAKVVPGQRLAIEKSINKLYFRINGNRIKESECAITNSADLSAQYYGSIYMENSSNSSDVRLLRFQHGGFINTGNRIEVSYIAAPDLAYQKDKVRLIVDKSGTGQFPSGSMKSYQVDEIDTIRCKLIFNNIFWDIDGNGKDLFTFGYTTSTKSENLENIDVDPDKDDPNKDNYAAVFYKNKVDLRRISVKVYLSEGDPYTLIVYDVSGRIIYKGNSLGSKEEQVTDINLPQTGFYLLKVISKPYQYTTKIVSN